MKTSSKNLFAEFIRSDIGLVAIVSLAFAAGVWATTINYKVQTLLEIHEPTERHVKGHAEN